MADPSRWQPAWQQMAPAIAILTDWPNLAHHQRGGRRAPSNRIADATRVVNLSGQLR
jgi:hypothetical protein